MYTTTNGYLAELGIEVTRKCNFTCGHCLRGDAQNVDFNPIKLRQFLSKNKVIYIGKLLITGGEPFLAPDVIIEIIREFQMADVEVQGFYIATNGSQFHKIEVFQAISRLVWYCSCSDMNLIEVSNSKWHIEDKNYVEFTNWSLEEQLESLFKEDIFDGLDEEDTEELEDNYDLLREKIDNKYTEYNISSLTEVQYGQRAYLDFGGLLPVGRAATLMGSYDDGSNELVSQTEDNGDPDDLRKFIYINALGEIIEDYCDVSFKMQKKMKVKEQL